MNNKITTFTYCGYQIIVTYDTAHMSCRFDVVNNENKTVMISKRHYDSPHDAYVRACMRINDEL